MTPNRPDRQPAPSANLLIASEVLRQSADGAKPKDEGKDEKAIPVFWRVFGGTMLSITALVVLTAFNNITGTIAELRNELSHLNTDLHKELARSSEAEGQLARKDEVDSRLRSVWRSIKEMQEERKELSALRERSEALMASFKSSDQERQRLGREVRKLLERQAAEEERRSLVQELQKLRERLAGLEGRGSLRAAGHSEKVAQ